MTYKESWNQLPWVTTDRGIMPLAIVRRGWRDQGMTLPQAMGSGPLARLLFYQYKCTLGEPEPLLDNGSDQSKSIHSGPGSLMIKTIRSGSNRPAPVQPREQTWGITPSPCPRPAPKPPQPRESGYAHHPNTGPGAEGGGGWPMHATAQPWHAEGRLPPTGALLRLLSFLGQRPAVR
jgi:hypothetical protein